MRGNIAFNAPRALVNFNDGAFGGSTLEKNLFVNAVRETGDHGPFNSYDRQPFLTRTRDGTPSYDSMENLIQRNFMISNFNSKVPLDHDDGSRFYRDESNVFLFGGTKNFMGASKNASGNW